MLFFSPGHMLPTALPPPWVKALKLTGPRFEAINCLCLRARARILVQVTINRRLLIGRDGHLDQSEAYDLS